MADYTVKRIDEMEGAYRGAFRKARSELGVTSFGMQVIDLPPDESRHPEHDHTHDGQEEVFLALEGGGELDVEGERIPLDRATMVRVGPTAKRKLLAGGEGLRVLIVGGIPGKAYEIVQFTEVGEPDPMASA